MESFNNLAKFNFDNIKFTSVSYIDLNIPNKSIIYCDPPYLGTTKYKDGIDYEVFWRWCEKQVSNGNKVYVSEYKAPEKWKLIWEKQVNNSLVKFSVKSSATEKLFTL